MAPSYCVRERKACVGWVHKYFKDCLCNLKDDFSFSFGLISLVCWGVAEIPQIITNFRTKSSHGVSLAFLLTWVAGDIFNLVGCVLEPATVSLSHILRLLYSTSTILLVLQSLYYDYIYRWCRGRQRVSNKEDEEEEEERKPLKQKPGHESGIPIPNGTPKAAPSPRKTYRSARSLAGSGTPPFRSYMRIAKSGPSAMGLDSDSSSDDEAPNSHNVSPSKPRPIPRSFAGGYGTFLAASVNLPMHSNALRQGYIAFTGRKVLEEHEAHSAFGQWLGWLMAAIYMGGRLPQIWLNIKRGSVEGLNPFMFIFALIANVTYVASILVRTTEWDKIKANMAWLLDAVVCVALDLFIILQYIYYRYWRQRAGSHENYGDYEEASKAGS
ncbi:putative vacuolar amino acid transporter YPQ2 [Senna tora]|uniref:Putative vacuolar amino acid transporter YPQ2 n=1 Tax=Senna tora TaxID=362788 RepID=A0A834U2R0_9FABA|nr:putative vacuolar amino acid transporter YPQ2 [Senna tora]